MAGILKFLGRAVDDLVKMGYPREVAKRISSGELPMDYESRMARAMKQGYDVDIPQAHGTSSDIFEFTPSAVGHLGGGGVYTTPDAVSASKRGLLMKFRKDLQPNASPNTIPVLVKSNNPLDFYSSEVPRDIDPNFVQSQGYDAVRRLNPDGTVAEQINYRDDALKSLLSAAFDPEYTGSNILGSRMAPTAAAGLLGILGLTEEDLEDLE
jgi:hypothetical protein